MAFDYVTDDTIPRAASMGGSPIDLPSYRDVVLERPATRRSATPTSAWRWTATTRIPGFIAPTIREATGGTSRSQRGDAAGAVPRVPANVGTAARFPTPTRTRRWIRRPAAICGRRRPVAAFAADKGAVGPLADGARWWTPCTAETYARVQAFAARPGQRLPLRSNNCPRCRYPAMTAARCARPPELGRMPPPRLRARQAATATSAACRTAFQPLARWHYHGGTGYLIVATRGQVFVGDWIGQFQPGHLVLTGPRLPHNWISMDVPARRGAATAVADSVLLRRPAAAADRFPELRALPLLERAAWRGVLWHGRRRRWQYFRRARAARALAPFANSPRCSTCWLLPTFRLLLHRAWLQSRDDDTARPDQRHRHRITDHLAGRFSMATWRSATGHTESNFSRSFRRATGNTFTDFVNLVHVDRCLPAADGDGPLHHQRLLRRRLQQRRQLQPALLRIGA